MGYLGISLIVLCFLVGGLVVASRKKEVDDPSSQKQPVVE